MANLRAAMGLAAATVLAAALLFCASAQATVTVAWLPGGTGTDEIADAGLSPGLMSAGLGSVPAAQTYLDIGQGNRVFDSLYDSDLPAGVSGGVCSPARPAAVQSRAASAPAEIVPGLLAATLAAAGESCRERRLVVSELAGVAAELGPDDLLVAIEQPPPGEDEPLAIGIAGDGFGGNLESASTRLDGYVLSTDVAPTILGHLDLAVPEQMSGRSIGTTGSVDVGALDDLRSRMSVISERRGPVIGLTLLAWVLALLLVVALARGRRRFAVGLVGLAVVFLPLVLLLAAALRPSQGTEQLLVVVLPPLLGLLALRLPGYRALALASAVTVMAYAIDVIAGSPLTALSLLGPNPGLGVRFYGVGNELEAMLAVLVVAGTGAALVGYFSRISASRAAAAFLFVGLTTAFVFGFGRFGADVGAVIVLPFGAAVAAATVAARGPRIALLVCALPVLAVAAVALVDLASGAEAHLTRSVLDAGGLGELGDVAERRLTLSARSFARPIVYFFMPLVAIAAVLAILGRRRIAGWLEGSEPLRAGMWGALAAVAIGAVANDSGALILEIGAVYLLVFLGFIWAQQATSD